MKIKMTKIITVTIIVIVLITISILAIAKAIAKIDTSDIVHILESKTERQHKTENNAKDNYINNELIIEFEE